MAVATQPEFGENMVLKDNQSFVRDLPSFTNHSWRRRKRKDVYNLEFEIELPTNYQSETEIRALSSIPGQRIFDSALLVENYINVFLSRKKGNTNLVEDWNAKKPNV